MSKAVILMALVIITGCVSSLAEFNFELEKIAEIRGCSSGAETYSDSQITDNKIALTSYIQIPNACYKLSRITPSYNSGDIVINITVTEDRGAGCGTCLGVISLVYQFNKPLVNETRVTINSFIKDELIDTHVITLQL